MGKFTSAVILAAGNGTRFGGKVKKQYVEVLGVPCVVRTVEAFENCSLIDEIILVGDTEALSEMLEPYSFKKISRFVSGGETITQVLSYKVWATPEYRKAALKELERV
ncbi:MAG: 2-C-methyl-D-erythritol 4-phosphate cytidylyltransferase [Clostridia bacterium]|nr:2-C-methyl-D-erythritol 4-phosphate cytidylyltransferase [Clostridia bacterium]